MGDDATDYDVQRCAGIMDQINASMQVVAGRGPVGRWALFVDGGRADVRIDDP